MLAAFLLLFGRTLRPLSAVEYSRADRRKHDLDIESVARDGHETLNEEIHFDSQRN